MILELHENITHELFNPIPFWTDTSLCDVATFKDTQSSRDAPPFVTTIAQPNELKLTKVNVSHLFVVIDAIDS
jgi:hypothetical protein